MKVKVWNRNKFPHTEKYKGAEYTIAAGGFIEMEFEDAVDFKGQFTPMPPEDYNGDPAKFHKMIVVEWPEDPGTKVDPLVCHADGSAASSQDALIAKIAQYSHIAAKDELAERESRGAAESRIKDLEAQVAKLAAAIGAQPPKRGPGRPPKEASA